MPFNRVTREMAMGNRKKLGLNNLLNHDPCQYNLDMTLIFLPYFLATKPPDQTPT
jgi:hypothetical protein